MDTKIEGYQFHCSEHRERPNEFLLLQRDCKGKKRLSCSLCLFSSEKNDWLPEIKESIPLQIALQQPEKMIDKLTSGTFSKYLITISNIEMKDLEKLFNEQILKFELLGQKVFSMKEELKEKLKEYKDRQEKIAKLKSEFLERISFNSFCQLILQLQELDKQFKSDQYQQIEIQVSNIIDEMMKNDCSLIRQGLEQTKQNHKNLINKSVVKPKTDEIQTEITQQFKQYEEFIANLNKDFAFEHFQAPEFKILSNEYFRTLQQKIELDITKSIKQMTLIYLGSRDGLNGNGYWGKVNGKRNLLMIFKSKNNNYIFGGYTPLQWQQLNASVQDDTLQSFLFSQTRNEIYPLKQTHKQYAIYSGPSWGPLFGNGHDMYIALDFTSGQSAIGNAYSTEKYSIQSNHLFGGAQPNICECEIYELIFE